MEINRCSALQILSLVFKFFCIESQRKVTELDRFVSKIMVGGFKIGQFGKFA
jgi:hypothetical protein